MSNIYTTWLSYALQNKSIKDDLSNIKELYVCAEFSYYLQKNGFVEFKTNDIEVITDIIKNDRLEFIQLCCFEHSPFCLFAVNTFKQLEWLVYRFGFDCSITIDNSNVDKDKEKK